LKTVKIKPSSPDQGEFVIINASDFKQDIHELCDGENLDGEAITVTAGAVRNMIFPRSAIALATRAPALPQQGDSAVDRTIITDPVSGLSFEVSVYAQYRQVQYEIALAWGCAAIKSENIGILLG